MLLINSAKDAFLEHVPKHVEERILEQTAQKMKFSIKDFFRKCDEIRSFRKKLLWKTSFWYIRISLLPLVIRCYFLHKIAYASNLDEYRLIFTLQPKQVLKIGCSIV